MIDFILSLFFPVKCPYCSKTINRNISECNACRSQFSEFFRTKSLPSGEICTSPFVYDSAVKDAVIGYKFYNKKYNAKSFSTAVCNAVENVYKDIRFDIVTYVPLSKQRYKERGFDQSELIARNIARYFEKPFSKLLSKTKHNREQHTLSAKDRIQNVKGVYSPVNAEKISGKTILIIDDVVTTGNTLAECCRVLKDNGADKVLCATVAVAGDSSLEYKK